MGRVELLVVADVVLTMEPGAAPIDAGAVAIAGDRIVDVGPAGPLLAAHPTAERLGGPGHLAVPGLVNGHQHLTGDRLIRSTIPDDLASERAIFDWAVPVHAAHRPDDDELSATLSLVEGVVNGVTFTVEAGTVADPERVLAAFDRVGVGGTLGSWGSDTPGLPGSGDVDTVLARQREVLALTQDHPRVHGWVTLVGHDLMSDELVTRASALALDAGTGLTFHLSPTAADGRRFVARTGHRPLVHLDALGALGRHVLVAHAVHVDDDEVAVLLGRDVGVVACPWAYLRLGQGVTKVGRHAELARRGGRLALGCDAENAGDAVDVLRAAALFAGLAKDAAADPAAFGAADALRLATLGGAEAVGLGHELGSLRPGKRADVVLVDTTGPAWTPSGGDPYVQLVFGSDGRAVRHVVSAGRVVVRDGACATVDHRALAADALAARARLLSDAVVAAPPASREQCRA